MVRVSEINLNEKDIFFPYHHWYSLDIILLLFIYYIIHVEKVFFKSSSCLKYIQKNLIEITKKMYTVSHWHADLYLFYLHTIFCIKTKAFLSLGTFRQVKHFHPKRDSSPWKQEPTPILDFVKKSLMKTLLSFLNVCLNWVFFHSDRYTFSFLWYLKYV